MTATAVDPDILRSLIEAAISGRENVSASLHWPDPVYLSLRRKGRKLSERWRDEGDLYALFGALRREACFGDADAIELCLTHSYRLVPPHKISKVFANTHRGIRGIELCIGEQTERHGPTALIAGNRNFRGVIKDFADNVKIPEAGPDSIYGHIKSFAAFQFLIRLRPKVEVIPMFRGGRIVEPEEITADAMADMIKTMSRWMFRNVADDGRMTYKYWPSRGEEATSNNTIRQFMATLCLIRLAGRSGSAKDLKAAERNLDYNLEKFFRVDGDAGVIEYEGKAKLGAAALAALAILELPDETSRRGETLDLLSKGVACLWCEGGSFRTFHKPAEQNDNQNFYPGEALLFWAGLYARTKDSGLLDKFMQSFGYYRDWHRNNRNPAFIPWHTQAYVLLYAQTGNPELKDFIFEMNDWLLSLQQWGNAPYGDLRGRFYDPRHPEYGPPHASSTGVYMEGLADAYRLALDVGDQARAKSYQEALRRGLRSIRQLQFIDDMDMYYIQKRRPVEGAVRTETYNNEIRVDNVQHPLMALLKLDALKEGLSGFAAASKRR
ncbi:MAG: hypothetical protein A3G18_09950 [Rhodospirillales bacterium RIFCSPLOWO2_12_FULL_58_28]|nr:MAG: hypothetical protein A3H92_08125 [Rhodospirillales bacterium RIFCSPLOWO2_02_FULL_58_16]OHC77605.1 MAG: hypothetical protein A3G18_09950 [Rhodospirillales bacterium RIFCSPLOWO2_12_FULL_58_28]